MKRSQKEITYDTLRVGKQEAYRSSMRSFPKSKPTLIKTLHPTPGREAKNTNKHGK